MTARWTFLWNWGRAPRSDPNAPAVPRYWALACTRCDWSSDYVDRFRGPVAKSKRAHVELVDHLEGHVDETS